MRECEHRFQLPGARDLRHVRKHHERESGELGNGWWGKFWEVKEHRRKMGKEETVTIDLLHRAVPAKHTDEGVWARGRGK
jgi:hypothetical protein